ncbi:hypothetical protein NHQ30_009108 [Ciborinia camelliae]|nr:hypothetical protein NHQ30_009108 [Ciborinia camelliae]
MKFTTTVITLFAYAVLASAAAVPDDSVNGLSNEALMANEDLGPTKTKEEKRDLVEGPFPETAAPAVGQQTTP